MCMYVLYMFAQRFMYMFYTELAAATKLFEIIQGTRIQT